MPSPCVVSPTLVASLCYVLESLRSCAFFRRLLQPGIPHSTVFYSMGYPIASHYAGTHLTNQGGFNIGGLNASGQVHSLYNHLRLSAPHPLLRLLGAGYTWELGLS